MQLEVDVRGFDAMLIRVRAIQAEMREEMQEAITEGSETGYRIMLNRVPRGETGKLAGSVEQLPIRYSPGGPGGGGFWESEIIAGEGVPYANVVLEGSGVFYLGHPHPITASNGNIRTKVRPEWRTTTGAKFMVFRGRSGHLVRKKQVLGQPAQTFWLLEAQSAARAVVEKKIAEMAVKRYLP